MVASQGLYKNYSNILTIPLFEHLKYYGHLFSLNLNESVLVLSAKSTMLPLLSKADSSI